MVNGQQKSAPGDSRLNGDWCESMRESMREKDAALKALASWHISLSEAARLALQATDTYGLPQTLFRTQQTCGWTHTNTFATVLNKTQTELAVTILPARFFE